VLLLCRSPILLAFCISLCVAMQVESEGWNIFAMIGTMLLINPLIMLLGQIPEIGDAAKTETILWSTPLLSILAGQVLVSLVVIVVSGWVHCRKKSFY
jgi:ABC-2 type transport system permease protein